MNLTLSIWLAISILITPTIVGIVVSILQSNATRRLTIEMQALRKELSLVKDAVAKLPSQEGRLFRLENLTQRRQRK